VQTPSRSHATPQKNRRPKSTTNANPTHPGNARSCARPSPSIQNRDRGKDATAPKQQHQRTRDQPYQPANPPRATANFQTDKPRFVIASSRQRWIVSVFPVPSRSEIETAPTGNTTRQDQRTSIRRCRVQSLGDAAATITSDAITTRQACPQVNTSDNAKAATTWHRPFKQPTPTEISKEPPVVVLSTRDRDWKQLQHSTRGFGHKSELEYGEFFLFVTDLTTQNRTVPIPTSDVLFSIR